MTTKRRRRFEQEKDSDGRPALALERLADCKLRPGARSPQGMRLILNIVLSPLSTPPATTPNESAAFEAVLLRQPFHREPDSAVTRVNHSLADLLARAGLPPLVWIHADRDAKRPRMKTLTMKLPERMLAWLERESKRSRRPKSAPVREILEQHQRREPRSALDLAEDLCGCVQSGLRDLSHNKKHLKGFGQ